MLFPYAYLANGQQGHGNKIKNGYGGSGKLKDYIVS
jgi:hypothetical protein